jgi:copper homeostasis protein
MKLVFVDAFFYSPLGVLEIAVFNIQSAAFATQAGADRIELCENPADGGTTPSYGTLKTAREKIAIPVFPIIRPRGGDFCYGDDEYNVMKEDIQLCKRLGFEGIVIGILNIDGSIDTTRTKYLVDLAYPMEVTFHRAFDRAKDPLQSLEDIINCGCQRILTSGQVPNAWDGKELIKELIQQANERIIIMPGSGVRSNNIKEIANFTGAIDLHSSARKNIPSQIKFVNEGMKETMQNISVDAEEIKKMKEALQSKN